MAETVRVELRRYSSLTEEELGWDLSAGVVWIVAYDPDQFDGGLRVAGDVPADPETKEKHLAEWPVAFLEDGQVREWDYLNEMCNLVADRKGRIYLSSAEDAQEPHGKPLPGKYYFKADDGSVASYSDGPDGKKRFQAPEQQIHVVAGQSSSGLTSSNTSGSDPKAQFRYKVSLRDTGCILTDRAAGECEACHIIPKKREDIYRQVLGLSPARLVNTMTASCGILLNRDIHKFFEDFGISFYVQDEETLVLHIFVRSTFGQPGLHGTILKKSSFFPKRASLRSVYPPPNWLYFRWHYAQAVKMHVRGFAWGIRRDAIPASMARAARPPQDTDQPLRATGPRTRSMASDSR